jgi:hypothetical protein
MSRGGGGKNGSAEYRPTLASTEINKKFSKSF